MVEGQDHKGVEESAVMAISRTTVTEIYERAGHKISDCIVNGKQFAADELIELHGGAT